MAIDTGASIDHAAGVDPGIIPERFLIGAVRLALDRRHARPEVLTKNFFKALASG